MADAIYLLVEEAGGGWECHQHKALAVRSSDERDCKGPFWRGLGKEQDEEKVI